MAHLIIARDVTASADGAPRYAAISSAWLDRFPGQFEKVRDADEPITAEEQEAEKATAKAEQEQAKSDAAAAPAPATPPAEEAPTRSRDRDSFR